jgi:hypothetical protein
VERASHGARCLSLLFRSDPLIPSRLAAEMFNGSDDVST